MLSVHQATVIAFIADGGIYHKGCMSEETAAVEAEQEAREEKDGAYGFVRPNFWEIWAELYPEITPMSRYEIDEWAGQEASEDQAYLEQNPSEFADRIVNADLLSDLIENLLEDGADFDFERWVWRNDDELFHGSVHCDGCSEEIK